MYSLVSRRSDVPTKVLLVSLNEGRGSGERVVLRELDDTTVLLNPKYVQFAKEQLQKHSESNTYQPPVVGLEKRL